MPLVSLRDAAPAAPVPTAPDPIPVTQGTEARGELLAALEDSHVRVRQMADSGAVVEAFCSSLPADAASPEIIGIVLNEKGAVSATEGLRLRPANFATRCTSALRDVGNGNTASGAYQLGALVQETEQLAS